MANRSKSEAAAPQEQLPEEKQAVMPTGPGRSTAVHSRPMALRDFQARNSYVNPHVSTTTEPSRSREMEASQRS
jgi:hypothetical protein